MENECEALPGVAYPGVRDNRSTINTKTGYDDIDISSVIALFLPRNAMQVRPMPSCSVYLSVCSSICLSRSWILSK